MTRNCFLRCLTHSHPPIPLPHQVEVIVGRNKETQIRDMSCSRKQLSLKADYNKCEVEVKQIGANPSGLEGFSMIKDAVYTVRHGTILEILFNNYEHFIEFSPEPEKETPAPEKKTTPEKKSTSEKKSAHLKRKRHSSASDQESSNKLRNMADGDQKSSSTVQTKVWSTVDKGELYIYSCKGVKPSSKIAAFDMDGTIITTKSEKVHPINLSDWKFAFVAIPHMLKKMIKKGFKIVIFTNQAPIGNGRVKIEDFKMKIERIVEELEVPIEVYIATGRGFYRKPAIGMWLHLTKKRNGGLTINFEDSFYCGDAAGRAANWAPGKKKDHSMADKLFAENIGLKFLVPEEFFLNEPCAMVALTKPVFEPKSLQPQDFDKRLIREAKDPEILVFVGYPGSGKSFLSKQIVEKSNNKYKIVSRDKLGTWQKCVTEAKKILSLGFSVIVDCTNPDTESRRRWVNVARDQNITCRCAVMNVDIYHARHNNKYRELVKEKHVPVPDMVFYSYRNKYQEPSTLEGFDEVLHVNFNPSFEDEAKEELYKMYLLEK